MLRLQNGTATFRSDQTPSRVVQYWDTTMTVPQQGIEYALFDVLTPSYNPADIEATLNSADLNSVLGYAGGAYRTGVVATINQFWGAGSPTGVKTARRTVMKYSGTVTGVGSSTPVLFVFGGYGRVQVVHEGVTVLDATIKEPLSYPGTATEASIEQDLGYQILPLTISDGDELAIYYLQNGEAWGGFFAKVISDQAVAGDWDLLRESLRNAPFVGSSLLSTGAVSASTIPNIISVSNRKAKDSIAELQITVALTQSGDPSGFYMDTSGVAFLVDNATGLELHPKRLVTLEGGFAGETYSRFYGHIEEIMPQEGTATITCRGLESKLERNFDENYPDPLMYMAYGYVDREWRGFPVYNTPAFDAWPLETALAAICARAGIDAYNLGQSPIEENPEYGRKDYETSYGTIYYGTRLFAAKTTEDSDEPIYLQRNRNYGNSGVMFKEYLPIDDAYIYPAEVSDRLYDKAMALANQYGYDFYFNAAGQAVIGSRNNPTRFQYVSTDGVDQEVTPSALGGRYFYAEESDGAWTKEVLGYFSRLDVYTGIGSRGALNGGVVDVTVEEFDGSVWNAVPAYNTTFSTYYDGEEKFFYDDPTRSDGTNATVFTVLQLPFSRYRVTLSGSGPDVADVGATDCVYRINGVAIFENDPMETPYPEYLSTINNLISLQPESNERDRRNHVVVVGARKATVSDSAKFQEQQNPNNPMPEFFVSVSADPLSVYDPTAANFTGGKEAVVIIDGKVTDGDFAKWLSRLVLYRYRTPRLSAQLEHTVIPTLEVRDPLRVFDAYGNLFPHLLWVESFEESWDEIGATVSIQVTSYPELPSYTPRQDVDIALFGNVPITNFETSYLNLYGEEVTNADLDTSAITAQRVTESLALVSDVHTMQAHGIIDTVHMYKEATVLGDTVRYSGLANNPYQRFWLLDSWTGFVPKLRMDLQVGDGTAGIYDMTGYGLNTGSWYVSYDKLISRTGLNPYYDPYTSEIGNLVSIRFDALVSGLYRVSIWAANEGGDYDYPVAWLTEPTSEGLEPESHWVYTESGQVEFLWDGVDNIGFWNRKQSEEQARILEGSLGEGSFFVGAGFYAWNDQRTFSKDLHTQIGDPVAANYDSNGNQHFTIGGYGKFYVRVEVRSDVLLRQTQNGDPLEVLSSTAAEPFWIWTHLGEPTQAYIQLYDWDGLDTWTVSNARNGWVLSTDSDATIRGGKPVKATFTPVARRGPLFEEDADLSTVQLVRSAHLKATVFDQFWTHYGTPWEDVHKDNNAATNPHNQEAKRLTSRMYHNEDHTIEFRDDVWRTGASLASFEWVFQPSDFEKDFGGGIAEVLRYGDYTQLESLPGYDPKRQGGTSRTDRAFINLAYISYLFYLEAHTLDRSGRRQGCINASFIDRSKIVTPDWLDGTALDCEIKYPQLGADKYLMKSIFVRQWIEPGWADGSYAGSPVTEYTITDAHQLRFVQPSVKDFDPYAQYLVDATNSASTNDLWWRAYASSTSAVNTLGDVTLPASSSYHILPGQFGTWTFTNPFDGLNYYSPSPCRDFHPYWTAFMPDWIEQTPGDNFDDLHIFAATGTSTFTKPFRDIIAHENWFGFALAQWYSTNWNDDYGATLEIPVQQILAARRVGAQMAAMFDYVRQDTLDRFDQYRGVVSRAPFASRDEADAAMYDHDRDRISSRQPVKPAGQHLLNLGRYVDYIVGPIHIDAKNVIIHATEGVSDFYDIRFRKEYLWQSDRWFPIWEGGASAYHKCREEYTQILPSYAQFPLNATGSYYDSGAWCGWKDDATDWATDPHLRWKEIFSPVLNGTRNGMESAGGNVSEPFPYGGYGLTASGGTVAATGAAQGQYWLQNKQKTFYRADIFGSFSSRFMRLAVGPETPESTGLIMNLSLPDTLRG